MQQPQASQWAKAAWPPWRQMPQPLQCHCPLPPSRSNTAQRAQQCWPNSWPQWVQRPGLLRGGASGAAGRRGTPPLAARCGQTHVLALRTCWGQSGCHQYGLSSRSRASAPSLLPALRRGRSGSRAPGGTDRTRPCSRRGSGRTTGPPRRMRPCCRRREASHRGGSRSGASRSARKPLAQRHHKHCTSLCGCCVAALAGEQSCVQRAAARLAQRAQRAPLIAGLPVESLLLFMHVLLHACQTQKRLVQHARVGSSLEVWRAPPRARGAVIVRLPSVGCSAQPGTQ